MKEVYSMEELADRWIGLLRNKAAKYERNIHNIGMPAARPDIDDICNEMIAYFTAAIKK